MNFETPLNIEKIGYVNSPYKQKFGTPRQSGLTPSAQAVIKLFPQLVPEGSLAGLEEFSHLWLIFLFHENGDYKTHGKVKPPRLSGEKMGVFATRSPHRPNPIGLSLVKLESVDHQKRELLVSGIDLIHNTPLLDIKPYIGLYDSAGENATWPKFISKQPLNVIWSEEAELQLLKNGIQELKNLIDESLSHDHRNRKDKKDDDLNKTYRTHLQDFDISYKYDDQRNVFVLGIKKFEI